MAPLILHVLGRKTYQLWFLLMVSIVWTIALEDTEDKTFNLKIGFDLTHGAHGASSLRIRNFEENDPVPEDDEKVSSNPSLRAVSASSSGENMNKKNKHASIAMEMKAVEESAPSDDENSDGSDYDKKQRSTKGLRADEYEPENPIAHEKVDDDSESESSA